MKTYTYFSKGSESVRLHSGEQGMIVVPMKPQPDEVNGIGLTGMYDENYLHHCPLGQPGDTIHVKGKWRIIAWGETFTIQYEDGSTAELDPEEDYINERWCLQCSDDAIAAGRITDTEKECFIGVKAEDMRWRSPVTMPLEAIRTKLINKGVQFKRVQELTEAEAEEIVECHTTPNNDGGDYNNNYLHYGISEAEADGWPYFDTAKESFESYIKHTFGLTLWEENVYVWVVQTELLK